jgi:hypothetical protein
LGAIGAFFGFAGTANAVDEVYDYARASLRVEGPCVLQRQSEACDAFVAEEHQDSIAEGVVSFAGGLGIGGLCIYMASEISRQE